MNILVIGNGFDLAHGLPTKYDDFLDFCEKAKKIYTLREDVSLNDYKSKNIDNWEMNDYIKNILLDFFSKRVCKKEFNNNSTYKFRVTTPNTFLNEFYSHIGQNAWLEYFLECRFSIGKNWIDFELEISKVIQCLDELRGILKKGGSHQDIQVESQRIIATFSKTSGRGLREACGDVNAVDSFVIFLNVELERLIRALEIYISEFVGGITVAITNTDIEKLNPDHVLSFNYSDTYKRKYGAGKNILYSYIHGKADISKNVKNSNLVLGIDEYLDDGEKDKELVFLVFKKFYQRIYKSTGSTYLNWVDEIKDGYAAYLNSQTPSGNIDFPQHTLHIFGHSLDVTDKDVLKMLICNDNVQTEIYYYRKNEDDKSELGKLIRNLILIMGPEELIRRTGGAHKTISFVPQTLEK